MGKGRSYVCPINAHLALISAVRSLRVVVQFVCYDSSPSHCTAREFITRTHLSHSPLFFCLSHCSQNRLQDCSPSSLLLGQAPKFIQGSRRVLEAQLFCTVHPCNPRGARGIVESSAVGKV